MCLSALAQTAVGSRSGRTRTGAVAGHCEWERPAARKYGPVHLDQHLLVVLLELRRPRDGGAVGRRRAVGRAGAVPDGGGGGQPQHDRHVRVAEPHEPPARRQRAEQAPPQLAAAHAPPAAPAPAGAVLRLRRLGDATSELRGRERRAALRGGGVDAVVAPALPVRLDAALVGAVHAFGLGSRPAGARLAGRSGGGRSLWESARVDMVVYDARCNGGRME